MAAHRFIEALVDGRPLELYGDGSQLRDFTYVDDVVVATVAALTADIRPGTTLNVAAGAPVSIRRLIDLLGELVACERFYGRAAAGAVRGRCPNRGRRRWGRPPARMATADRPVHRPRPSACVAPPPRRRGRPGGPAVRTGGRESGVTANNDGDGGPRLLVYSQDGLGLGHLRRTSNLIAEVLSSRPEVGVLTVSDSPLGKFFPTAGNHDYLKLPSIRKAGPGNWNALALPLPFPEVFSLRRELLRVAALRFRPDVVLVDHMPHGAMGELLPTLKALRPTGARIVLGLRDILDAPEVVRRRWSVEGAYEAVNRYYDRVLVYGSRAVFDLPVQYGWPPDAAARLTYCGYVCPHRCRPPRCGRCGPGCWPR
jgi:hypothetical protein